MGKAMARRKFAYEIWRPEAWRGRCFLPLGDEPTEARVTQVANSGRHADDCMVRKVLLRAGGLLREPTGEQWRLGEFRTEGKVE